MVTIVINSLNLGHGRLALCGIHFNSGVGGSSQLCIHVIHVDVSWCSLNWQSGSADACLITDVDYSQMLSCLID